MEAGDHAAGAINAECIVQNAECPKKKRRPMRRKRQGWDIHYGYILHLIGMADADIAAALKITKAAVEKRRKQKWAFGRA